MQFNDIFNSRLSEYLKSGSLISGRFCFLILLFRDLKQNNFDLDQAKKDVFKLLKVSFFNEMITMLYEVILLKDIEKAVNIVLQMQDVKQETSTTAEATHPPIVSKDEEFPDDIPDIDKEAFEKRQANWDLEFLKSVGWKE